VTTDERISRLEGAYEQVSERLGEIRIELSRMSERIDAMNESVTRRLDTMDGRIDTVNGRFDTMNGRFDTLHRTMLAGIGLILAAVVGLSFA